MKRKKWQRIKKDPHVGGIDTQISAGVKSTKIAERFNADPHSIIEYRKHEYPKRVASAVVSSRDKHSLDTLVMRLNAGIEKIEKITEACDEQLAKPDGSYDLSNPKKAAPYVKMLIEAMRVLSPSIRDMANVMGAVKERAEIENNPVLILAQIGQVIQTAGSREEMIAGIKRLAQDNNSGD